MNDTIIMTKRLLLRYQREDDIDFVIELWTDEEITKFAGGPRDKVLLTSNFNDDMKDAQKKEFDLWYMELRETGELAGNAGVLQKEIDGTIFHEVCFFMKKKYWGNGYAAEISKALMKYMNVKKGIDIFIAIIDKDNIRSKKTAERIGMKYWKTEMRNNHEKDIYRIDL